MYFVGPGLMVLATLAACGGSGLAPTPTVDQETARLWAGWATEAHLIATTTSELYRSARMLPSQAMEQQETARTLAEEIRSAEPSDGLVLRLADDLDDVVEALEFGIEYAQNSGRVFIDTVIPTLPDALIQLADNATVVTEALEER